MSSQRQLQDWLADTVAWGLLVEEYTSPVSREALLADRKTQLAVVKCIEVIGEACGQISRLQPELAGSDPNLELAEAYRMRNRLVHGYFAIDAVAVWNAATIDVPRLISASKSLLDRLCDG